MHEEARDPLLAPARRTRLAGPVAAQADLHVAARVDVPCFDEPEHRRPVRELDAEDLAPGVRVRVEVDEADRAAAGGDGADVRLGDRVVAAEHDRQQAGVARPGRRAARSPRASAPRRRAARPRRRSRRSSAPRSASTFDSRCGPGGHDAARIARGPKRAPGRSETRSSVGAPTIATSNPASSAGSCVYGAPP